MFQNVSAISQSQLNGEPAVLVHHGKAPRWRCCSLVTQRPLSLLL